MARGGPLVALLHRYTQAFFTQLAQSVACNQLHSMPERLARWMLMTQDRAGDEFPMTHDFMAQMLGVHRPGVTGALQELQRSGALDYERGLMRVVDRALLEEASCECYRIIRAEFGRGSPERGDSGIRGDLRVIAGRRLPRRWESRWPASRGRRAPRAPPCRRDRRSRSPPGR